ncbi:hypothetical protein [Arthrobacter sp.]|uniref:hypothetical protein n=1 Tax=Arthrobacter sp. TaxID=1667 RepID=UPI0026E0E841|nr:hypothetical protein [Arthrobacter sp.]MDO5752778.1 hypothetical protein [Arthrobacter sp.]
MNQLTKVSGLTLAASLALVGCSASSPMESPNSSPAATQASEPAAAPSSEAGTPSPQAGAEPATGKTIEGSGYSFVVPEGWAVPAGSEAQAGVDKVVADMTDKDGFADNVTVALSPAKEVTPEQAESTGVEKLEKSGAKDAKLRDRVTIGGSEAVHLSALFVSDSGDYQIEQYYVSHENQTYIVTFSFSPTVSETDRDDLAASVLATWPWA